MEIVKKKYIILSLLLGGIMAILIMVALVLTILTGLLGGYAVFWSVNSGSVLSANSLVYFHAMFGFAAMGIFLIISAFFGYTTIVFKWKQGFFWLIFFFLIIVIGEVGMAVYIYLERTSLIELLPYIWNFVDDTFRSVIQDQLGCCNFGNTTFNNETFIAIFTNTSEACRTGQTALCYDKLVEVLGISVYVIIGFMVTLILLQLGAVVFSILLAQITTSFRKYQKMEANEKSAKTSMARIPRGKQNDPSKPLNPSGPKYSETTH